MKKKFIDSVRVNAPCTQAWDEMIGNNKVRFCTHCAKDVNNISAMTRKEARRIVRKSGGSLCIRYIQRPETKAPLFAEDLTQITRRRVPLMAAGVMTASLSLSTLVYAQGGAAVPVNAPAPTSVSECEDLPNDKKKTADPQIDAPNKIIRGKAVDPNGAVIPNLPISLSDRNGNTIGKINTDVDGGYRFEGVKLGSYVLVTTAQMGFAATEKSFVVGDEEAVVDITVDISAIEVSVGGAIAVGPEYEGELAIAVAADDVEEVRNLLVRREDPNHKEEDGTTPLFVAVENGNIEVVTLLLDFGAKVNIRNDEHETVLMSLDEDAPLELVELLLRYEAKVNRVTRDGDTALIRAAGSAKPEVLLALIKAGAELNAQNDGGMTALMNAAGNDNLENVRVLLLAGADVNLRDREGDNAWDHASAEEIEKLLVNHGVALDPEDLDESDSEPEDNDNGEIEVTL